MTRSNTRSTALPPRTAGVPPATGTAGVSPAARTNDKPSPTQDASAQQAPAQPPLPKEPAGRRRSQWALALLLLCHAASAQAVDLLGQVVTLGERGGDPPRPLANTCVTVVGAGSAVTTASGRFELGLRYAAGTEVKIEVAAEGLVIYKPHEGKLHLPRPPAPGTPPDEVLIRLLPVGDHRLLDDYTIRQTFEQVASDAQEQLRQQLRPDGRPNEIDFTRYLEDLGRRLGFSLADIEAAVGDWQARKRDDPDADLHEQGLVALSEKRFADTRRLFRRSRLANEQTLSDAEQQMAELQASIDEQRRLVLRDLRAEAEAAALDNDFAAALALYQQALERIERAAEPEAWARAKVDIGNARQDLGIRVGGADAQRHLADAVDAYRAALTVYTRDTLPQDWAGTQNNLAIALQEQGIRAEGEGGARLFAQAIAAYGRALSVFRRDALRKDWAMTQNNLANAYAEQGTRTGGEEGARLLAEAVAAYRAALSVYARDPLSQDWAMTQNNLGTALQEQGTRTGGEDGARLLAEAVAAYRAALSIYARNPLSEQWATTQSNLGLALQEQGTRTGGEDGARLLVEAVAAYRAALTVRTREALPYQSAQTQMNLLGALAMLGDTEHLAEVLDRLLRTESSKNEFYTNAYARRHNATFEFATAFGLASAWTLRHPNDLDARCNLAETLLTTGRTADARQAIAALIGAAGPEATAPETEPLPAGTEAALRLLELAALTRLAADGDAQAEAARGTRRAELTALLAAQPGDFAVGWSFQGTLHFLATDPGFAAHRDGLLPLFEAAGEGRDALLAVLR